MHIKGKSRPGTSETVSDPHGKIPSQKMQNENSQMQVEWGQLLLEQSTWGSYNRVEQLATKKLKMHVPSPNEIVMVEP